MKHDRGINRRRRDLIVATTVTSGVAGVGAAFPLVNFLLPSERAKALGAPIELDISTLAPGHKMTIEWRGQPVWVLHRSREMLAAIRADDIKTADPRSERKPGEVTPPYARNEFRSIKPEIFVVLGVCSHLGCSPQDKFQSGKELFDPEWHGGFYCPCHGALYDFAGRVFKNKPAPDNLTVPPHHYVGESKIVIGADKKEA